jgi:predicted TIM-barrel fold metal-dependent hydrolase
MILDAHTHLFPEEVQKDRSAFCSRDESFRQLYGAEKARMASLKELLQSMDREGVDGSLVCGFPWSDPGLCREGNDYLLHCAQRTPHRIIPFATVSLGSLRRAEKELERCLSRGAKGIGELAFYRGGITPRDVLRLSSWAQTLADTGVPLLLHVNEPVGHDYPGKSLKTLQPIYQFLQRVPDVNVILAHWGGGFFFYELMPEVARVSRNVHYDTAASPFLYRPQVYSTAVQIIGPDRILWGSDFPLLSPSRYFRELAGAGLSSRVRAKIQGGNAKRLLGLHRKAGLVPEYGVKYNRISSDSP